MLLDRLERIRRGGSRAGGVEAGRLAIPPDDREGIPADPGRHRLGNAEHGGSRERGVGCIPAALEGAEPRPSGERLARGDHRVRGHGWRPGRGRAPGHAS